MIEESLISSLQIPSLIVSLLHLLLTQPGIHFSSSLALHPHLLTSFMVSHASNEKIVTQHKRKLHIGKMMDILYVNAFSLHSHFFFFLFFLASLLEYNCFTMVC